jgi:NADPH-dependent curcumin reductase CurA
MAQRNRQILLVAKPTGRLGAEHFRLSDGAIPVPQDGEQLLRIRYISMDAANRAWMQGATYCAAVEAGIVAGGAVAEIVEARAPGYAPGRFGLRQHRVAGLRGGAGRANRSSCRGSSR